MEENFAMEKIDTGKRAQLENDRRERLHREKPLAYEKIIRYADKAARGEPAPAIDITYDYACNMRCAHCCNACFAEKSRALTLEDLRDLSRQADQLGLGQFVISGGEPMVFPDLDGMIEALDPSRFHIAMSTNGLLMTRERAEHLKKIGLDKVKISLDSLDEDTYNQTRQQNGAYNKAIQGIMNAKDAGLQVALSTLVSHQNCISEETERLARFAHENKMNMDINLAKAVGRWEGHEEVLVTPEDIHYLVHLRNQYPEAHCDFFPTYGKCGGCNAVKGALLITKFGDVLPCAFIHISIGNIFEEPLGDILARGFRIKWFRSHPVCLSGFDRSFIRKYMSKFYGKPLPISWREAFTEEDFIDGVME